MRFRSFHFEQRNQLIFKLIKTFDGIWLVRVQTAICSFRFDSFFQLIEMFLTSCDYHTAMSSNNSLQFFDTKKITKGANERFKIEFDSFQIRQKKQRWITLRQPKKIARNETNREKKKKTDTKWFDIWILQNMINVAHSHHDECIHSQRNVICDHSNYNAKCCVYMYIYTAVNVELFLSFMLLTKSDTNWTSISPQSRLSLVCAVHLVYIVSSASHSDARLPSESTIGVSIRLFYISTY